MSYKQYCERSGQHLLQRCGPTMAALEKWKKINESFSRCFDKSWIEQSLASCIKKNSDAFCFCLQLYTSTISRLLLPAKHICPVGRDQRGGKWLGVGHLFGRRVGVRNSDGKGGQEMGKGFIRQVSCVSGAVWRSLWCIPDPDHRNQNQDNQLHRLSLPYHTCQTCSCS